jgi:hypothetical protein
MSGRHLSFDTWRAETMRSGVPVEVRSRYDGRWNRGFEIAEELGADIYRVRRLSDGSVLPVEFSPEDVRQAD